MGRPAATGPVATRRAGCRSARAVAAATLAAAVVAGAALLGACGSSGASGGGSTGSSGPPGPDGGHDRIQVVAAENFWGSIAAEVGGSRVEVTSIISNPNTDPHEYEPTSSDARALSGAQVVIENGIGYDPWVAKLVAADGSSPTVLDVGSLLHVADGGNPHRWYDPVDVQRVVDALVADYTKLDPSDRATFAAGGRHFEQVDLAGYHAAAAAIRRQFSGTRVGASESIFAMLAPSLDLDLVTPPSFLRAISEGTDPTVGDRETIDRQIRSHQIAVYVYNSQNVTPDVQSQLAEVRAEGIPVATITETMAPASSTFQAWQTHQLLGLERALARARAGGAGAVASPTTSSAPPVSGASG